MVPPDSTLVPPGSTVVPSGSTVVPPGSTLVSPGSTLVPPGSTLVSPASTLVPPGSTLLQGSRQNRLPTLSFSAIAGRSTYEFYDPQRKTPIHPWHIHRKAVFEDVGQWKRPWE